MWKLVSIVCGFLCVTSAFAQVGTQDIPIVPNLISDNVSDNHAALQAAATAGGMYFLPGGHTYRISAAIIGETAGFGFVSDGTATIYGAAADFSNATLRTYCTATSTFLCARGETDGDFTPLDYFVLRGVRLESEVAGGRKVDGVDVANVRRVTIEGNEFFGFPVGLDIKLDSVGFPSSVSRNYAHDRYDNTRWGPPWQRGEAQLSFLEVDNDRINHANSGAVQINNNIIRDIAVGPLFVGSQGYQTDGINVQSPQGHYQISGNTISNTGEGIDNFAADAVISDNVIEDSHKFGIKNVYFASNVVIQDNSIRRPGKVGIYLQAFGQDMSGVLITRNQISDVNPEKIESGTAGIALDADAHSVSLNATYRIRDTIISDNVVIPGNGDYAIVAAGTGTGNQVIYNKEQAGNLGGFMNFQPAVAVTHLTLDRD